MALLSGTRLIAPTYITVVGTKPGQGVLLTRDRASVVKNSQLWLADGPVVQVHASQQHAVPTPTIV